MNAHQFATRAMDIALDTNLPLEVRILCRLNDTGAAYCPDALLASLREPTLSKQRLAYEISRLIHDGQVKKFQHTFWVGGFNGDPKRRRRVFINYALTEQGSSTKRQIVLALTGAEA